MVLLRRVFIAFIFLLHFSYCSEPKPEIGTGKVNLTIIDSPTADNSDLEDFQISIKRIEILGPDGWINYKTYEEPISINLFNLKDGSSLFLGEKRLPAGSYSEVKIILDTDEDGEDAHPSTVLNSSTLARSYSNLSKNEGQKAKGEFYIASQGIVNLVLSLNTNSLKLEKSPSGDTYFSPDFEIRILEDFGIMDGFFEHHDHQDQIRVTAIESQQGPVLDEIEINTYLKDSKNIKHTILNKEGIFRFSLLSPGTYDLYFHQFDDSKSMLLGKLENIEVQSSQTTKVNVSREVLE